MGLEPETDYYLASVGVSDDGRLILIGAHGSAVELADRQLAAGAQRAVITEEGCSCAYALWECTKDFERPDKLARDAAGNATWSPQPQYFGMTTYWRRQALALGVVQLREFFVERPFREERVGSGE